MKILTLAALAIIGALSTTVPAVAQEGAMKGMDTPMKHSDKMAPQSILKPAQGASVKIIAPKAGQVVKGDSVPLEFKMTKGKVGEHVHAYVDGQMAVMCSPTLPLVILNSRGTVGEHVHAYVDGQMAGMFKSDKGTLNGIKPGQHTLELRVATGDHNTELDATDKVTFTTK